MDIPLVKIANEAFPGGDWKFIASVLIAKPSGEFLALQRSRDQSNPLAHGIPGGKVVPGERVAQAAAWECFEETGLFPRRLLPVYYYESYTADGVLKAKFLNFIGLAPQAFTPRLNEEHIGFSWNRLKNWPEKPHPMTRQMFNMLGLSRIEALATGIQENPESIIIDPYEPAPDLVLRHG